jgi:CBS domain-containing protein
MERLRVHDVMTRDVVTASPTTAIADVVGLLEANRISAVPIIDDLGRPVGVVSEADLLPMVVSGGTVDRRPSRPHRAVKATSSGARAVMSTRPISVAADTPLSEAAKRMRARRIKRLLVTDDTGRLIGIVSRSDLLRQFARPDAAIRRDIIRDVLQRRLWIDSSQVQAQVDAGVVTLTGNVGRRTTAAIAARLAATVPGVVTVTNHIGHDFDDEALARSRVNRTHPFGAQSLRR